MILTILDAALTDKCSFFPLAVVFCLASRSLAKPFRFQTSTTTGPCRY